MTDADLKIPDEFKDQLIYVDAPDTRSDEEILSTLAQFVPVTSEKNIWAFWHSGITQMPAWCQRNVIDWVRINGPSWTVRVLDNVPDSPNYVLKHLAAESLPQSFVDRSMDGPYVGPHSADFLRGATLIPYGGVFMDVGNILFRPLDMICWKELEDPNSPLNVAVPWMYGITIAQHLVAARKGDPFIQRWHELFVHLWGTRKNHEGLLADPLLSFSRELTLDDARASNFHWNFKVPVQTVMEYITQVLAWMRVTMLEEPDNGSGSGSGFNGVEYWTKNIKIFDVLQESWGAEAEVGFEEAGQKIMDLLSLQRDFSKLNRTDEDEEHQRQRKAYDLVWRLLTKSSLQKITHGKNLTHDIHLGALWDMPENQGKDRAKGTYAELLRYGSVHFLQTRPTVVTTVAPRPAVTLKKGLLEP